MKKKKLIITALIIASFILLIISVVFFIIKTRDARQIDPLELESMTKEEIIQSIYDRHEKGNNQFYYFIPIFAFFGLGVGALIYYLFEGDIEKKQETIKQNYEIIFNLLNPDERKVLKKIVENSGKIQQIEITYMEGFTKVKAHRIIESLVQKGILTKETLGKMRLIRMNQELYEILKK